MRRDTKERSAMRTGLARAAGIALILGLTCTSASAQLYRWVDANGVTQYSDKAPDQGKTKVTVIQPPPAPSSSQSAKQADWQTQDLEFRKRQVERVEAKRKQEHDDQQKQ